METNNPYTNQQFNDNEESGFDIKYWIFILLRHWYLFVLFGAVALGMAYLKNRTWIENYSSSGTIIINENRGMNSNVFMQGFGVQSGYKNTDNQVIMLTSYDLLSRVVDSLPYLATDYISKGRFRTRNLYDLSPITVVSDYVDPNIYNILFKLSLKSSGNFEITNDEGVFGPDFVVKGRIDRPIQHSLFFLTIHSNESTLQDREVYFRFRNKESLINDFMGRLHPEYVMDGSSVIRVSLQSETPQRDIDFINKLFDVFLDDNLSRKNDAASKTIAFIDQQLEEVSQSLAVSEGNMTAFRRSNRIVDLSSHSSGVLSKATQYDEQQSQLRLRENYLNYLDNYLKTNLDAGVIVAPSSLGLNDAMLISLVQQFNDVIVKKNETSEKNPLFGKYEREVASLKISINEVIKNMRKSMEIEQKDLSSKLQGVQRDISSLPLQEMQLVGIERKYRVDDNYYTFFLQKRAEAAIQKASNSPDNNILDKARIITLTNGNAKSKTITSYLIIGLLIPLIFVVLKELLNSTIRDTKDIEKSTSFPLIGTIKHTNGTDPLLAAKHPRSSFTEMFRVIRTRLEFIVQRKSNIVILITSAESGDGKTYFSTNLASVYGMTGKKTLLIDMDIRKPSINDRLSLDEKNGVTNFVIGENTLDELILQKEGINFDILLAGTIPPNPGELIRSDKLKDMITTLREIYDYIIIYTSPVGLVADSYSIASSADVKLLIARSKKTSKPFFKRLNEQIKNDNLTNFYTILNDVDLSKASQKYSNNYGYGYGYGYGSKKNANRYTHYYEDDTDI
jgi:capsular exopolysaccharide synthesis family protein